ncbi:cAMP-dependent protein kinase inhibitor beta-like isoform X2 [Scleropages formosus]|nr:cAMP-dependent protein kinase inhibitor beta-like isoform X2 [Scleropages formosus]
MKFAIPRIWQEPTDHSSSCYFCMVDHSNLRTGNLTSCHLEMTEVEPVLDFASSGRSGRRNALPDILGSPAGVSPSDLPLKLAELSLTDGPDVAQSPTTEESLAPIEGSEGKDGS